MTIPGRQIRIVTAKPQIIVSDASPRTRGFMHANNAFMPITGGPYVASVVPMNFQGLMLGAGCSQTSAASSALRAIHEMENQGHEVATQLAAHKASTDYLNAVLKSVQARMPAPANAGGVASADPATLQQCLDRLEKRIGDVEKLLIYHDNALKDVLKNQSGK